MTPVHVEHVLEGTVGSTAVVFRFRCDPGAPCSGYRFDRARGVATALTSQTATDFTDEAGARYAFDHAPDGSALEGSVTPKDGSKPKPVALRPLPKSAQPQLFLRTLEERAPSSSGAPGCGEKVVSFEVAGVQDPRVEQALNAILDPLFWSQLILPEPGGCPEGGFCVRGQGGRLLLCQTPGSTPAFSVDTRITVTHIDADLLSAKVTGGGYAGGMHSDAWLSGLNVDLRTGAMDDVQSWFSEAGRSREYAALVPSSIYPPNRKPDIFGLDLSGADRTTPTRVTDPAVSTGGRNGPLALSSWYVTPKGLGLIPMTSTIDTDLKFRPAIIPWSALEGAAAGPLVKLAAARRSTGAGSSR